ncbi:MAG: ATP-binding protein [Coriobacteriales bacterium]|jgi:predicted AAA+ superfamily ATPase|nr:ATP-binding protein [Coriobacteriales bacterium]
MERHVMQKLVGWKGSRRKKPLIINGARQVGKTWLLKEFGARHFDNVAYINFDNNAAMRLLFDEGYDTTRLLTGIQAEAEERIIEGETLIIFDEIQECPKALTSLKYFSENTPSQLIVAAGSLLGLAVHQGTGYPVGKVTTLDLFPLSFREFLDATGNQSLRELIDSNDVSVISSFSAKLVPLLRQYYFTGGMPEVVAAFTESNLVTDAREVQNQILSDYRRDISKHLTVSEAEHTLATWDSIPAHLGQENRKFIFGHIKEGSRARDYRSAITWLVEAGLAVRVRRITKPGIPLVAYAGESSFKLFLLDIGLLGAMAGLDASSVISGNRMFAEFKGALTEQYVCQQLVSDCGLQPFYWSAENSRGEIDFLVQNESRIYPIEVKAEENLRSKSLRAFNEKYRGMKPRRFSLSGYRDEGWMCNVPLFAVGDIKNWE